MVIEVLSVGGNPWREQVVTLIDMHMKLSQADEAFNKIGYQCHPLSGNYELLNVAFDLVGIPDDFDIDPEEYYVENYQQLPYDRSNAEAYADWLFSLAEEGRK